MTEETAPLVALAGATGAPSRDRPRRKRGRPLEMQPEEVLGRILRLADQHALFRVHLEQPALYARARRLFGSWAGALAAAHVDHDAALAEARRRAHEARRRRRGAPSR